MEEYDNSSDSENESVEARVIMNKNKKSKGTVSRWIVYLQIMGLRPLTGMRFFRIYPEFRIFEPPKNHFLIFCDFRTFVP